MTNSPANLEETLSKLTVLSPLGRRALQFEFFPFHASNKKLRRISGAVLLAIMEGLA
jgi:hypothetical protein